MKKLILAGFCILLFLFFQTNVFSQKKLVKVNYTCFLRGPIAHSFETELIFNDSVSQFIERREPVELENGNYTFTISYLSFITQTNLRSDSIIEQRHIDDDLYLIARWYQNYKWEIKNEFATVGAYKVQKAVTNSFEDNPASPYQSGKVTAWFCPDIPVSSGPARYGGLPGLILHLEYEYFSPTFVFKSIEYDTNRQFVDISKGVEVVKEDVIFFDHKNTELIKEIKKNHKKNKPKKGNF